MYSILNVCLYTTRGRQTHTVQAVSSALLQTPQWYSRTSLSENPCSDWSKELGSLFLCWFCQQPHSNVKNKEICFKVSQIHNFLSLRWKPSCWIWLWWRLICVNCSRDSHRSLYSDPLFIIPLVVAWGNMLLWRKTFFFLETFCNKIKAIHQ